MDKLNLKAGTNEARAVDVLKDTLADTRRHDKFKRHVQLPAPKTQKCAIIQYTRDGTKHASTGSRVVFSFVGQVWRILLFGGGSSNYCIYFAERFLEQIERRQDYSRAHENIGLYFEDGEIRGSPFGAVEIVGIRHATPRDPFREIAQEVGGRDGLPKVERWPRLSERHGRKRNLQMSKKTPRGTTRRNPIQGARQYDRN